MFWLSVSKTNEWILHSSTTFFVKVHKYTLIHKFFSKSALNIALRWRPIRTDSTKINCPGYNVHVYWTNIFEKTLIDICSPHLYASFGTFCQFGKYFAACWVFKHSEDFRDQRHFPQWQWFVDFQTYFKDSMLTVPRIIEHFGVQKVPKEA